MKQIKNNNQRNYGIDIIKILAVILVLSVHFFLQTKYYEVEPVGIGMRFQSIIRNFCMMCVPLFLMATGFLNKKEKYNKNFFKSLSLILIVWLFYSIIEYFTLNILNKTTNNLNIKDLIFAITSFKASHYSWYIEMYIGLYLISPIINVAYKNFDKENRKNLLLLTISLVFLPNFINTIFDKLFYVPNWWYNIYPLAYYLIGKYISDTHPNVNKKVLIILLILNQVLIYSYNYIASIEFNSFLTFVNSTILFLLLYNIQIKNSKLQKIVVYISSITLDIYLASGLIDKLLYPQFKILFHFEKTNQQHAIIYAPIIVISVFIISTIYGSIRKKIIHVR